MCAVFLVARFFFLCGCLGERSIDIIGMHSKTSKQGIATIEVSFHVKGREELVKLIDKIRQVESVIDIERTAG